MFCTKTHKQTRSLICYTNTSRRSCPDRAVTLVPHVGEPKIRNLELGNSKVSVADANHSDASRAAHATAKIMAVTPEGMPSAPAGCKCACTVS